MPNVLLPVNSLLVMTIKATQNDNAAVFINRLCYRLTAAIAEVDLDQFYEAFWTYFKDTVNVTGYALQWGRVVCSQVTMTEARLQVVNPIAQPFLPIPVNVAGTVATSDYTPRRTAVLARYSMLPGRKGVGRVMVGPIGEERSDGDVLDVDINMTELRLCLESPINLLDLGVWNPCIAGQIKGEGPEEPTHWEAVTEANDVRRQLWSRVVTYLRSRSLGKGQ